MSRGRFKSKGRKPKSNNMARRKGRKSKSRRKSSSGSPSGVFSGKILGFKIPLISDTLKNKTVQKAIAGAGIVSIALSLASLVNNPSVNKVIGNKIFRLGLAGAAGDVTGIVTEFAREGGIDQIKTTISSGGAKASLVPMVGGGVA